MTVMGYGRLFLMDMIPWSVLGGMASTTMINSTAAATAKLQGLGAAISKPQASFSFSAQVSEFNKPRCEWLSIKKNQGCLVPCFARNG
jgi:hypothetical protein